MPGARPAIDVVMPFAGSDAALAAARRRLAHLRLRPGDTVTVADNRPGAPAGARPGSYFARNRGAEQGSNPWLVFLDADVEPPENLLDEYFAEPVGERVGVLVGGIVDEAPGAGERVGPAVLFAHHFQLMSQERTLARPEWAYAQTANCAVRREAFDAVGGFTETIRSGGDADICFRIRDAGWAIERRAGADVVHRSRPTVRALLRQRARVGAGARWLEERYPGFAPRRPLPRALAGATRQVGRAALKAARGDREGAVLKAMEGITDAAFQLGWRLRNELGER